MTDGGAAPEPRRPDADPPTVRAGGPTELVPTDEGELVERLSSGTATLLLIWLIGIGAATALLALWGFMAIVLGERLGLGDLFSSLGFYVSIFGASGPVVLWLTGRAQSHSLPWFLLTALKIGGVMFLIVVAFGAVAALLAGPGIGVGGVLAAGVLAVAIAAMSLVWALATWAADWYIARARTDAE